jgi:hypothetical protein
LFRDANVRRRIDELRRDASRQAGAALEVLIPQLEQAARTAIDAGRLREATRALGKLAAIAAVPPVQGDESAPPPSFTS